MIPYRKDFLGYMMESGDYDEEKVSNDTGVCVPMWGGGEGFFIYKKNVLYRKALKVVIFIKYKLITQDL